MNIHSASVLTDETAGAAMLLIWSKVTAVVLTLFLMFLASLSRLTHCQLGTLKGRLARLSHRGQDLHLLQLFYKIATKSVHFKTSQ
jgi:hypothetical protein